MSGDRSEIGPLCPATTENRYGNRKGHCSCVLPVGHDGEHLCQAAEPCRWADESGRGQS